MTQGNTNKKSDLQTGGMALRTQLIRRTLDHPESLRDILVIMVPCRFSLFRYMSRLHFRTVILLQNDGISTGTSHRLTNEPIDRRDCAAVRLLYQARVTGQMMLLVSEAHPAGRHPDSPKDIITQSDNSEFSISISRAQPS